MLLYFTLAGAWQTFHFTGEYKRCGLVGHSVAVRVSMDVDVGLL